MDSETCAVNSFLSGIRGQILYRHLLLEEGFIKVMNGLVMTLKEDK